MLAECERGERHAVKHYEDALKGPLPDGLRAITERQCAQVREAAERVGALRKERPG
jgi:uncharacterized protein (TIGR02284 family)